MLFIG